jgi:hypothetical protein
VPANVPQFVLGLKIRIHLVTMQSSAAEAISRSVVDKGVMLFS